MLPELKITRIELESLEDVLQWSPDGTLAVQSTGELTFLTPKYTNDQIKTADPLFDIKKLSLDSLPRNMLFANEISDERGSTFLTSVTTSIVDMKWSMMFNNECYLALLTAHLSVIVLKDGEVFADVTSKTKCTTQHELDGMRVHCLDWIVNGDGQLCIIQGVHSGDLKVTDVIGGKELEIIHVCDSPIVKLRTQGSKVFAVSLKNEVFVIEGSEVLNVKGEHRFMIYDLYPQGDLLFFTTCSKVTKLELSRTTAPVTLETGLLTPTRIIPSNSDLILLSETASVKVNSSFSIIADDKVEPVLSKRLQAWTRKYNDFNTKKVSIHKYGSSLNYNGNVLAVLYDLQQDSNFKYIIASSRSYSVGFITLENNFTNVGTSLSHFHEFKFTNFVNEPKLKPTALHYDLDLKSFLKQCVYANSELIQLSSQNLIFADKDPLIRKTYSRLLISYIDNNKMTFDNLIDQAVVANLRFMSGETVFPEVKDVTINAGAFSEVFNFGAEQDNDTVVSLSNHIWQRCCLTFLPVITPHVKLDPATSKRALDTSRDKFNDFGVLTRALLEASECSIYTGCRYLTR